MVKSQNQGHGNAHRKAATTGVPSMDRVSLWKKFKQICGAEPGVDLFDAGSFDDDAKALEDDAAPSTSSSEDGCLEEKAVG